MLYLGELQNKRLYIGNLQALSGQAPPCTESYLATLTFVSRTREGMVARANWQLGIEKVL